jgi:hypothetical protein
MRRSATCLCIGVSVCALTSVLVWAQATAQINGTVKDGSGAVLPGVEITVTQTETGISRNAVSDETGTYILPNLAVGPYRLEAGLPGFRTYVQTGIVLQVNSSPLINAVLEVGQVTEHVEVQANAALVETRNQGVGTVIENQRILELPLNGRQVTDLISLAGAAVQLPYHKVQKSIADYNVDILVAGGLASGVSYRLDGANHNDPYSLNQLPLPFPDALQEFKVETSALSAQSGMSSGASVNAVTKSGTNNFHGSLFEFVRNDLFNARNYFATQHGTLKRNQFGGALGGPIKRNKLFFFGGYQGTTIRSDPADRKYFVPTAAMLAGDFTAFASPACNGGRAITLKAPFVNNRVDPALFSKATVKVSNRFPKTSDPCGLVTTGSRRLSNEHQATGKIDYQFSDRQSMFGRFLVFKYKLPTPYSIDGNLLATDTIDTGSDDLVQSYTFGNTFLISPTTVNALHLGVNRAFHERLNARFFSAADLGIPIISAVPQPAQNVTMRVTSAFAIGNGQGPNVSTIYNLSDDLSLIRGTHQIGFGANVLYYRTNTISFKPSSNGQFSFNGQTTGLPLADFLMGATSVFQQFNPTPYYLSQSFPGAYAADTWRMTPRWTLNYGLRWEPFLPQVVRNGTMVNFSDERMKAGVKSSVYKNAPAGLYYPGDAGFPGTSCRSDGSCSATGMESKWRQLMPRVGLAWDVYGDGRMSMRASYAMAHDQVAAGFLTSPTDVPPFQPEFRINNPPGGVDNPWLGYPGGNPFPLPPPSTNVDFPTLSPYGTVPYDNPQMARHMWNLSLQRQVGSDWLVSASYMGSHALHLWYGQDVNYAVYIPGNCQAGQYGLTAAGPCSTTRNTDARRRLALLYPNNDGLRYSSVIQLQTGGTQTYNGMLISLERRAARGLTIGGNYTWSHCYGNPVNAAAGDNGAGGGPDPNDRSLIRGNCEADRRHILNMTAVAQTPQFANPALRTLATGWTLSTIFRKSSGDWLTIAAGEDRALNSLGGQNAQQVLVDPYGEKKSLTNYLNPAAFTLPALGTIGNMRPASIQGPGYWGLDAALSRAFRFGETQKLDARFEAFNVTNSLRRGNPDTNLASGSFGRILNAADARILQFSLKYAF